MTYLIHYYHPVLLDIVKSSYVQVISDANQFIIQPQINFGYEIDHWTLKLAGGVPAGDNLSYKGIGPYDALFDNEVPEGRALNRTVTVTLEFAQKE